MSSGRNPSPGQGPPKAASRIVFWKNKEAKLVDPRLFSERAEWLANQIKADHIDSRDKKNKPSQLRKFYDEVVRLDELARKHRKEPEKWGRLILPSLHMLIAKAAYAQGRDLVSPGFRNFIKESVEQVEDPEDLGVFAGLFEAFMGFYKGLGIRG